MGRGDYVPSGTRKCLDCGKDKILVPGQPMCYGCHQKHMMRGARKIYNATKCPDDIAYRYHPDDLPKLETVAKGCSPAFIYRRAWENRSGKCSMCRSRNVTMRVELNRWKTGVKSLFCKKCWPKHLVPKAPQAPKRSLSKRQYLWARADVVTKTMLSSSPTFMAALEKEILDNNR